MGQRRAHTVYTSAPQLRSAAAHRGVVVCLRGRYTRRMGQDELHGVTMSLERVGDLLVVVHTDEPPTKDDWSRFCRYSASLRNARGELRALVAAGRITAGPNASQRAELNSLVPQDRFYVAVLCDTFAARAALN